MPPPCNRTTIVVDVGRITAPDVCTVDALVRLALAARRLGLDVRVRHPSRALTDLINLAGLTDVLGLE